MKTKSAKTKTVSASEPDGRKFHHGNLREALLTRLLEVLDEEGVEGIGVRRLARDLGVDPASVYRHFRDLDALSHAAAEACFVAFAGTLERAAARSEGGADEASARASFLRLGEAYLRFASAHPHRFRLMFGVRSAASNAQLEPSGPVWEVFLTVVKRGVSEGADAALDARMSWSMMHGVAALMIDGPLAALGSTEQRRLIRRALDVTADAMFKSENSKRR